MCKAATAILLFHYPPCTLDIVKTWFGKAMNFERSILDCLISELLSKNSMSEVADVYADPGQGEL